MHFLIVNDDGIDSPFLPILTQAVKLQNQLRQLPLLNLQQVVSQHTRKTWA